MIHKIVRANGATIQNVKSCVYKRDINGETNLRAGCVSSACIEVTVFGKKSEAPDPGEKLLFYQISDNGNLNLIGTFYAEPAITSRMTFKFVAYDKVARLDADFSARLWELQSSFPMTLYQIVSYAATVAGVTLDSSVSSTLSGISVKQFYADNITCRQIFSWAAELVGKYVIARTDNEQLTFAWYSKAAGIRVYPTSTNLPLIIRNPIDVTAPDGTTINLNVLASNATGYQWQLSTDGGKTWRNSTSSGYNTDTMTFTARAAYSGRKYRCVVSNSYGSTETDAITLLIDPSGTYVEPTDSPMHYNTETAIAYRQNGLQYENYTVAPVDCVAVFAVDESETSVLYPSSGGDNIYSVYNNLLLTDANSSTLNSVASKIYTALHSITEYRPATIKLFPSENPISTGSIVAVTDAQGFSFATIVMSIVSDGAVDKLKSTGTETYEEADQVNQKSKIINMASSILRLKKLIVDEVEAIIARIDTLFANEITVTGSLHSPDYQIVENRYEYNQPYAATGLGLEFGEGTINGQYFSVSRNGGVYCRNAYFGDFYFTDALLGADSQINIEPYQFVDTGGVVSTSYETISVFTPISRSYNGIKPVPRLAISGYKANEPGKFVFHIPAYGVRYLNFNALADVDIVQSLEKPVATVTFPYTAPGVLVDQGSVTMEYGTYESASNDLISYKDALFYPVVPSVTTGELIVEIPVPAGAAISLDVIRGRYSAWYGWNNDHTYGGRGTYVGTDGISADKMQIGGNDVSDAISAAKVSYFQNQTVSATTGQIMRIPASGTDSEITADTVVLECSFANPSAIATDVTWTSYNGYIVFSGTCSTATTANVVLGQKNN